VSQRTTSVLAFAVLAGSLLFGLAVHLSNPVLPVDDAYITYRYSDNLLNGQGLVYNPGQKVFGSSTPLYVMWLAGLHAMARSVPTPELAVRANFVFYALTALGVFFLLMSLGGSPALAAVLAGLLSMHPSLLRASLGGMETFLFTGLLVWSLWSLTTRRFGLSAWLAGLSVVTRPEGMLMVAVVFGYWLMARRDWRELIGLFVPGMVWVAFATSYFGTPVYHSILAKSRPLYPLPAGAALGTLVSQVVQWTMRGWVPLFGDVLMAKLLLLVPVLAIAVFGYVQRMRSGIPAGGDPLTFTKPSPDAPERPASPALLFGRKAARLKDSAWAVPALLALFVVFYTVSNPLMTAWYYPPVECLWYVALALGVVFASAWLQDHRGQWLARIPVLVLVGLIGVSTLSHLIDRIATRRPATDMGLNTSPVLERTTGYRAAAEWLNQVVPPGDTLVAPEIGTLGYYYRGHVLDACGLVSPEALPFLPVPASERTSPAVGTISLELVKYFECDVVVTMEMFASRSLYPSDWFHQNYEQVRQIPLSLHTWGTGGAIDVFFRRGGRALQNWRKAAAPPG